MPNDFTSLTSIFSKIISTIKGGSPEGILLLLVIFFIALVILLSLFKLITGLRKGKTGLESVAVANTRKILINLSSVRTYLDRFVQKSTDPAKLRELRNRLNTINSEVIKIDLAKFNKKATSLEEWNAGEKALLDSSEKLAIELERQSIGVLEIDTIERSIDAVSNAVLNRVPVTPELNALYRKISKKERPEVKIPDAISSELNFYLNALLTKYANFSPEVLHTGDYPPEVKWEYSPGNKSITATLSNSRGISLVFETRWQESDDLAELVQKEAASVNKNHYKCLCLVNTSWDRDSINFAQRFSYPKLALFLRELKGGLYYNKMNDAAMHYEFWFSTELKKETLNELALRYISEHEYVTPADLAKALGMKEKGAHSLLSKLEKKGAVTNVSLKSDKTRKYTKAKKKE